MTMPGSELTLLREVNECAILRDLSGRRFGQVQLQAREFRAGAFHIIDRRQLHGRSTDSSDMIR
jgi:hypothetical protein